MKPKQLVFPVADVAPCLDAIANGYTYDPGSSDLDDEQPIHVRMTLGDYRRAARLVFEMRRAEYRNANLTDDAAKGRSPAIERPIF